MEINKLNVNGKKFKNELTRFINLQYIEKNRKRLVIAIVSEKIYFNVFTSYNRSSVIRRDIYEANFDSGEFAICSSTKLSAGDFFTVLEKHTKEPRSFYFFVDFKLLPSKIMREIMDCKKSKLENIIKVFM